MKNNGNKGIKYQCKQHLFLAWLEDYDGPFTYCCEIQGWIQQDQCLQVAKSVRDLKQRMPLNPDFEGRHFHKVDTAYEHFKQRCTQADLQMPASADDVP